MKSSKSVGVWRPVMGVAVAGAMALGVSALAAPRAGDQATRGTGKTGTEVTRLVTGDPTQLNAVAGVPPTIIIAVTPVDPPTGLPAYPAGVDINGQELTIDRNNKDGFRAWFNVQMSDWDPLGDGPNTAAYQVKINCSGYYHSDCLDLNPDTGGDGLDLAPPVVACPGFDTTPCVAAYGEGWAPCADVAGQCATALPTDTNGFCNTGNLIGNPCTKNCSTAPFAVCADATTCAAGDTCSGDSDCTAPYCDPGYMDASTGPASSWCAPAGGGCNQAGAAIGTCNYAWFGVSNSVPGHVDQDFTCVGGSRPGQGCNAAAQCTGGGACTGPKLPNYYGGTLVLDLPAGAKGKYVVNLNPDETFMASPGTPPVRLDSLQENGFVVNYVTGSCCHNLGTPLAGCDDSGTRICFGGDNNGLPCTVDADCGIQNPGRCGTTQTCLNRSDCETPANEPAVFNPGGACENKPLADGCSECTGNNPATDLTCDDGDACTTETCVILPGPPPVGVCQRGYKAGYNPSKGDPLTDTGNCCDSATGTLTDKDDDDVCTVDSCSLPDNRGSDVHDPAGALGTSCDDGNFCSFGDRCNGVSSQVDGGCTGTLVPGQVCVTDADCQHGGETPTATCSGGVCVCEIFPKLTYLLNEHAPGKLCIGGPNGGLPCAKPEDCPGGFCDIFPANCFDEGEKISALVNIGVAAEPINGGQFLIEYDPSCVTLNSIACLPPYVVTVYGPTATANTAFIACGVDPFAGVNGPGGNVNIVALNFTMIGQCNNCFLCFGSNNPQNTYLVNADGYKVPVVPQCKEISENGDLVLTVPDNIKTNSDCDKPAAVVTWDAPSASFSCGDVNLSCRGAHESGVVLDPDVVMGGGLLPQGANSFCCYAWAKDKCEQTAGCAGDTNLCPGDPKPDGCWTVQVNDETSMDIHVQLEPPLLNDEIERCIEFCLYGNCLEAPYCFEENVLFGGLYNFIGKTQGKIKVPKGKWGCITAQDQLHSLRSCDFPDCIDGQLVARFKGDPTYGGNWLIMGNIDAYKKALPDEDPSLDVIDILDFGKFVAAFGVCYEDRKYGCHEGTHADIDGDGCVTALDYAFIVRNFLVSAKDCCCGPTAADLPPALTEVTIEELRQMGQEDLIVADLNGDGVLNSDDMEAFTQGTRPVKPIDRKGSKGLRSGR